MKKRETLVLVNFNEHSCSEVSCYSLSLSLPNLVLEKLFIICFMENVLFIGVVDRLIKLHLLQMLNSK